jgi:hypothetical protein
MLPNPDSPKVTPPKRSTIFFDNKDLDSIAQHFIGNNQRFVNLVFSPSKKKM